MNLHRSFIAAIALGCAFAATVPAASPFTDGKSMTRTSDRKHEDGTALNDVVTVKRTAGDKGFEGTWESTEVRISFSEIDIEGSDTRIVSILPAENGKLTITFDGKEIHLNTEKDAGESTAQVVVLDKM